MADAGEKERQLMVRKTMVLVGVGVLGMLVIGASLAWTQGGRGPGQGGRGEQGGMMALNLTADQQAKAQAIHQKMNEQILAVLTPEQQTKFKALQSAQGGPKQGGPGGPGKPGGPGGPGGGMRGPGGPGGGMRGPGGPGGPGQGGDPFAGLNLTDAQKTKIAAIRTEANTKIKAVQENAALGEEAKHTQIRAIMESMRQQTEGVLTAEQLTQLQNRKGGPGGGDPMLAGLNLTDAQKAKVKAIRDQGKTDLRAILTAEQQARFDKMEAGPPPR